MGIPAKVALQHVTREVGHASSSAVKTVIELKPRMVTVRVVTRAVFGGAEAVWTGEGGMLRGDVPLLLPTTEREEKH